MKTIITPGRLYSKILHEFREVCCESCARNSLPVPQVVEEPGDGPEWVLGALSKECAGCTRKMAAIVRRLQAKYDLMDPVSAPIPRQMPPSYRSFH
jgi:hypothetical protein